MKGQRIEVLLGRIFLSLLVTVLLLVFIEMMSRRFISSRTPIEQQFPVQHYRHPRPYTMFSGRFVFILSKSSMQGLRRENVPDKIIGALKALKQIEFVEKNLFVEAVERQIGKEQTAKYHDLILKYASQELNSLGYKGDIPFMPKPMDEFRIFFLGGSTLVNGDPPIPRLVQELFSQNGLTWMRTYNFGVVSSVSSMELAKIVFELLDLEPDMIIMYNGGNDFLQPWRWDPRPGYPFNFIAYEHNPLLDKDLDNYPAIALFAYGSTFMRYFFRSYFVQKFIPLAHVRKVSKYQTPEWKEKIADIYVNNLVKADKISNAFGIDFLAFYQPLLYFKDVLSEEEQPYLETEKGEFAREMREIILAKIDLARKRHGVKIVDLSSIYKGKSDWVFIDSVHTKQDAKPLVAQEIYMSIADVVKKTESH